MILGMATPPASAFINPAEIKPETTLHVSRIECRGCDLTSEPAALLCNFHDGFNQGVEAGQFVCECKRLGCDALRHKGKT